MSAPRRISKATYDAGWIGLLEVIFDGHRDGYTGAKCRGRHHLFDTAAADPTSPAQPEAAALCARCPQQPECGWALTSKETTE